MKLFTQAYSYKQVISTKLFYYLTLRVIIMWPCIFHTMVANKFLSYIQVNMGLTSQNTVRLTHDSDKFQALVNVVTNIQVP
jgi:hypothetical protein